MSKAKTWLVLHGAMLIYSLSAICSKMAGTQDAFSSRFILWCCGMALCMLVYALLWQQVLKKLPLVTAYANKAVVILWGMVWGRLFFRETVSAGKLFGAAVVMTGIYLMVTEKVSND